MAGLFRTGLNYSAIEPLCRMTGIEITSEIFAGIRSMEDEALNVWAEKR